MGKAWLKIWEKSNHQITSRLSLKTSILPNQNKVLYHVAVVSCYLLVLTVLDLCISWGHGNLCSDPQPGPQCVPAAGGAPWAGESSSAPVLRRLRQNREKRDSRLRASALIISQAEWQQLPEEIQSSDLTVVMYGRWVCWLNCTCITSLSVSDFLNIIVLYSLGTFYILCVELIKDCVAFVIPYNNMSVDLALYWHDLINIHLRIKYLKTMIKGTGTFIHWFVSEFWRVSCFHNTGGSAVV